MEAISKINAREKGSEELYLVVDTPRGSRNKFKYDEELHLFKLGSVLPAGAVFPFDFGFVPRTRGGDGDALDVVLLMDESTFVGCLVLARLVGVIEAEQTKNAETVRNDRLIAVAAQSRAHKEIKALSQLSGTLVEEIEHFFVSYNQFKGREFKPLGRFGPERAEQLLEAGLRNYQDQTRS